VRREEREDGGVGGSRGKGRGGKGEDREGRGGEVHLSFQIPDIDKNFSPDLPLLFKKFGHLILREIIKIVATRCQILRLKCT